MLPSRSVVPVFGTTQRYVTAYRSLHRVPDSEVLESLLPDMVQAWADEGEWYAIVMFSDGRGNCGGISPTSRMPPADAFERMLDLAVRLNKEAHHNGHWIIGWVNGFIAGMWRARQRHTDEDHQTRMLIVTDLAETWQRAQEWSLEEMADRLEGGYTAGLERYKQT